MRKLSTKTKSQKGFTLLEILTTLTLMAVLAAIAIPTMQEYARKASYQEIVTFTNPYKKAIGLCFNKTGSLSNCSGGQNGIPANIINSNTTGLVWYLFTVPNGQIFVFPRNEDGFSFLQDYVILTPTPVNGVLTWQFSGPAVTSGLVGT